MRITDDDLSQSTVAIEKELRRPGVDAVGVPKREAVINGDRPADALRAKVLRHIPTLLLCGRLGGVNPDDFESLCAVFGIETAQSRHHIATIEAIDRKDVEDDDLARNIRLAGLRIEPVACVKYRREGWGCARPRSAGEQDGGEQRNSE